jgi:phage-related holin
MSSDKIIMFLITFILPTAFSYFGGMKGLAYGTVLLIFGIIIWFYWKKSNAENTSTEEVSNSFFKSRTVKVIVIFVLFVVAIVINTLNNEKLHTNPITQVAETRPNPNSNNEVMKELMALEKEMNATLPKEVGEGMVLDRVNVEAGRRVIQYFIIQEDYGLDRKTVTNTMAQVFKKNQSTKCVAMKPSFDKDVTWVFVYSWSDGVEMARTQVNRDSCNSQTQPDVSTTPTNQSTSNPYLLTQPPTQMYQPPQPVYVPPVPVTLSDERPAFSPYNPPAPAYVTSIPPHQPEIPTQELLAKQAAENILIDATPSDAEAQYRLGMQYYDGAGVEKNHSEAARLLLLSAQQGNVDAQSNIGVLYYLGNGIKQDNKQALYWIRKAVEVDNMNAQNNLGVLFYDGRALKKDDFKAQFWFDKAAAQGDSHAAEALSLFKN